MAGFTANFPDLMKADDALVPYFVVRPKCFPVHLRRWVTFAAVPRIRGLKRGPGISEAQ
jgi:hypothetical protein